MLTCMGNHGWNFIAAIESEWSMLSYVLPEAPLTTESFLWCTRALDVCPHMFTVCLFLKFHGVLFQSGSAVIALFIKNACLYRDIFVYRHVKIYLHLFQTCKEVLECTCCIMAKEMF